LPPVQAELVQEAVMMNKALPSALDYPLGTLGLALVLAVTRLVEFESASTAGPTGLARRAVARTGLAGVSVVGLVVDGLLGQGRPTHVATQIPQAGG
jgi:hypothetical protein